MSRRQRLTLLGIAAVIAVVAVGIALASGDDSSDETPATTAADQTQPTGSADTTPKDPRQPPPAEVDRIRVKNGEPVGGVKEIEAEKGDHVRIEVTSDVAEELHLHGYDISREVAAGGTGRLNFKADIEGVFELEVENSGVQIAELTVNP